MTLDSLEEWRLRASCRNLSAKETDRIFFPGSGGKPTKAKLFCEGCPTKGDCLKDAITNKLSGFFAGTTESERSIMAEQFGLDQRPIGELVKKLTPTAGKRRRYRHVIKSEGYTLEYLDELPDPDELVG